MRFESTWRTLPEQYTLMLDAVCIDSSDEQDDEQEGLGVEKDATKYRKEQISSFNLEMRLLLESGSTTLRALWMWWALVA